MSTLRTNNIANVAGTQSTDVLNVINGSAKAWVNFNGTGTGTVAIRASGNVSSITDYGVGQYAANFTTAMPDANFCVVGLGHYAPLDTYNSVCNGYPLSASSAKVHHQDTGSTMLDPDHFSVSIFR